MVERSELGEFLRARREQLRPADVGLRDSGRRRTPGLRREEVATLAGVSVDYLMRLEQGRDANPSGSVITALATALQLTEEERLHLGKLAAINNSPELCPTSRAMVRDIAPTVRLLLDRIDPSPAFVIGPGNDLLGWNRSWQELVEPLGLLDGPSPNLARFVFLDARSRAVFPDWSRAAHEQVSALRAASMSWSHDDHFAALLEALLAEPEFESMWSAHTVAEKHRGTKRLVHPEVGELLISFDVLHLPEDGGQRLTTWFPADEATETAMRRAIDVELPVSPAHLRVVREA